MSSTGAARASRVRWTICRRGKKVYYIEAIYPPAIVAEGSIMLCECGSYASMIGGVLGRDLAAQRCYEETI